MLRAVTTSKTLSLIPDLTPVSNQCIRWRRKPLWMPTAKSKLFRIPVKPKIPVEEQEELKRLFNNYRTQMKSIRHFLINKHSERLLAPADTEQLRKDFDEDFARCNEINNKWNEELKLLRDERLAKELEAELQFAQNRKAQIEAEQVRVMQEAEEIVRREKALVGTFITRENLDEAVEKAIANPVDYNFAIDLDGNRYESRQASPQDKQKLKQ